MAANLGRSRHFFTWRETAGKGPSNWLTVGLRKNCGQSGVDWCRETLAVEAAGKYSKG